MLYKYKSEILGDLQLHKYGAKIELYFLLSLPLSLSVSCYENVSIVFTDDRRCF